MLLADVGDEADPLELLTQILLHSCKGQDHPARFDLVVLDLMLPKIDGLEICRRLRSRSSVPIIILTAKSEEIDKVVGLELGADDYITKPFSLREFSSRIKAALRRAESTSPSGPSASAVTRPS